MRKLTIDRNVWLRGEGAKDSRLLRERDKKQCCVGIYLEACGVPRAELVNQHEFRDMWGTAETEWLGEWVIAGPLYMTNDNEEISDSQRETMLAGLFSEHGVDVEFVN